MLFIIAKASEVLIWFEYTGTVLYGMFRPVYISCLVFLFL